MLTRTTALEHIQQMPAEFPLHDLIQQLAPYDSEVPTSKPYEYQGVKAAHIKRILRIKTLYKYGASLEHDLRHGEEEVRRSQSFQNEEKREDMLRFLGFMKYLDDPAVFHDAKRVQQLIQQVEPLPMIEKEWVVAMLHHLLENAYWNRQAAQHFLEGYVAADAIYDDY